MTPALFTPSLQPLNSDLENSGYIRLLLTDYFSELLFESSITAYGYYLSHLIHNELPRMNRSAIINAALAFTISAYLSPRACLFFTTGFFFGR